MAKAFKQYYYKNSGWNNTGLIFDNQQIYELSIHGLPGVAFSINQASGSSIEGYLNETGNYSISFDEPTIVTLRITTEYDDYKTGNYPLIINIIEAKEVNA